MNSTTQTASTLLQDLLPLFAQGSYIQALDALRIGLTQIRSVSSASEWRSFCSATFSVPEFHKHPLSSLLKESPLGRGSGLIHEPLVLDVIYGLDAVPRVLKPAADAMRSWELSLGFCTSLRARHLLFARELNELGAIVQHPKVLAVGCGHLREAATALTSTEMSDAGIVAFDRDRACADLIQREYEHPGLRTIFSSLRDLTSDPTLGAFDFIYVPTLFDRMDEARVTSLLDSLLRLLKPGGRLLAANFAPDLADAAYLEACLDWWPFYRGEEELATVVNSRSSSRLRGQAIFRDDSGGSVFLDLQVI